MNKSSFSDARRAVFSVRAQTQINAVKTAVARQTRQRIDENLDGATVKFGVYQIGNGRRFFVVINQNQIQIRFIIHSAAAEFSKTQNRKTIICRIKRKKLFEFAFCDKKRSFDTRFG